MKSEKGKDLRFKTFPPYCCLDDPFAFLSDYSPHLQAKMIRQITKKGNRPICGSEIHHLGDGLWRLESMATNFKHEGKGYGTSHMHKVIDWLKNQKQYPARTLVFEIDSRSNSKITRTERAIRARRGRFYERLGAVDWGKILLVPIGRDDEGQVQKSSPLKQMEILAISLDGRKLSTDDFLRDVRYVMCTIGCLNEKDSLVHRVITGNFPNGFPARYGAAQKMT